MIGKWFYGKGIYKSSISKVFLEKGTGKIIINNKTLLNYFKRKNIINYIYNPLKIINLFDFNIIIKSKGGGEKSKAISITRALSFSLIEYNRSYKKILKSYLSNKNKIVERKKIGLIKSRKKKQYSKR